MPSMLGSREWTAVRRATTPYFADARPSIPISKVTGAPTIIATCPYGGGPIAFFMLLAEWRAGGAVEGLETQPLL